MVQFTDSITALSTHAADIRAAAIPAEVMQYSADLLRDTVACILAGSSAAGVEAVRETMLFWGGAPQARVVIFGDRTSAPSAAFINSVMGHARDFDDTHDAALNHGCVTIVPALLAVAEVLAENTPGGALPIPQQPPSGEQFIAALAIGLDVVNRLAMAFAPYLHTGWLPTTLFGPIGVAAACGRLLGFDRETMADAFGLAYAQVHGNRQALIDGTLAKRIQPAFSASAGIQAAFLALRGVTGPQRLIDGVFGYPALYTAGRIDASRLTGRLGDFFETSNVSIKPYPSCRCSHPVIDAALRLKREHGISHEHIASGAIYLPPKSMGQVGNPFAIRANPTVDAQFSAQYTAALTFLRGTPRLSDFEPDNVRTRGDVIELARRFSTVEHAKDSPGPVPTEVSVTLRSGETLTTRIEHIKGSPGNPMLEHELVAKFHDCADHAARPYSADDRRRVLDFFDTVLDTEDVTTVIPLLVPSLG